jgi:hypothetical protein
VEEVALARELNPYRANLIRMTSLDPPSPLSVDEQTIASWQLQDDQNGRALIEALQASPHQGTEIEPAHSPPMPVRAVEL